MAPKEKKSSEAIPSGHWERAYKQWEPSENMKATQGDAFAAKQPSKRKTTYVKVNEQDH